MMDARSAFFVLMCISFRDGYRIIGPDNSHGPGDPDTFRLRRKTTRAHTHNANAEDTDRWLMSQMNERATSGAGERRDAATRRTRPKLAEDRRRAARRRDASNARTRPNDLTFVARVYMYVRVIVTNILWKSS